ncbi:prolyl oligopeptidase family serine peptidase [Ruania halotolerans]|uniref:prolyl oligopeptidase family serine peptidase n=1 Tax=Ruania halotolerans TaxID=2897773 RepID=UPI001E63E15A|nr:prolyl oligopeptidase family serine peptidase [Ruania halotolerans]UFU06088.1 prolyl oligopeptidase family serine peptidase [Ruania halotolerans]
MTDLAPKDPYSWLENVDGEESLNWVRARNAEQAATLAGTQEFTATRDRIRTILDSDEKIPGISKVGEYYYNFWRDAGHERGIWRRTTLESYRTDAPEWEIVLDIDALNEAEGENWVWHGASVLRTGPDAYRLAIVDLSRGGADADVSREFDLQRKTFVDGGFYRPESKGGTSWIDSDTLFVFTDTGEGSMTPSGYPRIARRWRRGTAVEQAEVVYEGTDEDMYIGAVHDSTPGFERDFVSRAIAFYNDELYLLGENDDLTLIEVPNSANAGVHREWITVELREDWTVEDTDGRRTYPGGSLLALGFDTFLAGSRDFHVLYEPTPGISLADYTWTRHHLVLNILDDVKSRLVVLTPDGGRFRSSEFVGAPQVGTVQVAPVDLRTSDAVWLYATDFLTPTTLSIAEIGSEPEPLKAMPQFFDPSGLMMEQHFATSDDGTRVPYFLVRPEGLTLDGSNPTLLYGYGGFEISLTPTYSGALGSAWLERGGVYVLANIRGGGEYGPTWHQAALKENRHRAYEDMAAVAKDLVARGVTSAEHLGVQGGSNGGLLTGNMLTQYPDLFGAVVIQVPLLDMKRYSHLLAGASWMAEYGDPDEDDQWEFIRTFSPYHLFDADADYPPVLFTTSTRDDRVHPGHARKMAAQMIAAGKDVTYYENIEGGHGGAATNAQAAHMSALAYRFLAERLGL